MFPRLGMKLVVRLIGQLTMSYISESCLGLKLNILENQKEVFEKDVKAMYTRRIVVLVVSNFTFVFENLE